MTAPTVESGLVHASHLYRGRIESLLYGVLKLSFLTVLVSVVRVNEHILMRL